MAESLLKKPRICGQIVPSINEALPPEIFEKIFEKMDIKSICSARKICNFWKQIIDNHNIMKKALGKILKQCVCIKNAKRLTQLGYLC